MSSGPAGGQLAGRRRRPPRLSGLNPRHELEVRISYRGGSEAWWTVRARGRVWRRPGTLALHDVLMDVMEGIGGSID